VVVDTLERIGNLVYAKVQNACKILFLFTGMIFINQNLSGGPIYPSDLHAGYHPTTKNMKKTKKKAAEGRKKTQGVC
jgi:hypothetical protein